MAYLYNPAIPNDAKERAIRRLPRRDQSQLWYAVRGSSRRAFENTADMVKVIMNKLRELTAQ